MEKCVLILELQAAENSHFEYLINIYGIFIQIGCFQQPVTQE
jgi:hypothetical protein